MKTIQEIAINLSVSNTTVRNHLKKLSQDLSKFKQKNVYKIDTEVEKFLKDSILKNRNEDLNSEKQESKDSDMETVLLEKRAEEIFKDNEYLKSEISKKDNLIEDLTILFKQQQKLQLDANKELLKYKRERN
ncbi:HTH domain-containing protein [Staphylococcus nepalensis]|uniref:HTH domain-containing protein n=1 Tax=Staphylococcus sp. GDY8P120P TaxID=2804156 RepID=UPI001AEC2011|nr:HTH domain-containing protein [Staphylococcus sp. GDY8P120P]MDW8553617.1 HTH domain-containing protein [Staphylococcus nepalensis]MDW8553679.1 HTH domain-containing protein [Staphylococcus nepalensis]